MWRKRSAEQVARDRERIVELKIRGWNQCDVATKVGVSQPTVARELRAFSVEARKQMLADIKVHKATELERLNRMEAELWEAWEKSKTQGRKRKQQWVDFAEPDEGDTARKPVPVRVSLLKETSGGNPRYMARILGISDRRCRLLDLNKPIKMELPSSLPDVTKMSAEERARRIVEIVGMVANR